MIRRQQPYGLFAKSLLERQNYPDLREYPGGPPKRPYDVTAHTLPLLMGVEVETVAGRFQASLRKVSQFSFHLCGNRPADGGLSAWDVDSWKQVTRIWREGGNVWRDKQNGDFYSRQMEGLQATLLKRPRIGLYRELTIRAIDEGWTRWLLEQFGFEYARVTNADILAGDLGIKLDVLVFPDQSELSISEGYRKGTMPDEFTGGLDESVLRR